MTAPAPLASERFLIEGRVDSDRFPPWIERHAQKLGLLCRIEAQRGDRLEAVISGPPELLDAMEMACLLGPIQVWVDQIDRLPLNSRPEV
ncbi:acylphosphatase [Paracoccus cavernae]|uniref:acylphosphatase n=1 Tax=Paracoccus cavernae TaxID=1571207 RepID=UPI0035F3213A